MRDGPPQNEKCAFIHQERIGVVVQERPLAERALCFTFGALKNLQLASTPMERSRTATSKHPDLCRKHSWQREGQSCVL